MRLRYTVGSIEDLSGVREFIARESPVAAARVLTELLQAANSLIRMPARGRPGKIADTRELILPPYVLVYTVDGEDIVLLRVLHGARKWP